MGLRLRVMFRHLKGMWSHGNHGYLDNMPWKGKRTTNARIPVGHYHTLPQSRGNLYQAVRKVTGKPRSAMAQLLGISEYQLRYRERTKRVYHLCEVAALYVASGMTTEDFMQMINDIA